MAIARSLYRAYLPIPAPRPPAPLTKATKSHLAKMSEVPTRIGLPEAPVLEISINSYDTPENELIEPST
jgi:hypothetical protein